MEDIATDRIWIDVVAVDFVSPVCGEIAELTARVRVSTSSGAGDSGWGTTIVDTE